MSALSDSAPKLRGATPAPLSRPSVRAGTLPPSPSPWASYEAYRNRHEIKLPDPIVVVPVKKVNLSPKPAVYVPGPKVQDGPGGISRRNRYVPPSPSVYRGSYNAFKQAKVVAEAKAAADAVAKVALDAGRATLEAVETAQVAANEEWFRQAKTKTGTPDTGVPSTIAQRTVKRARASSKTVKQTVLKAVPKAVPSKARQRLMNSRKANLFSPLRGLPIIEEEEAINIYPLNVMEPHESRPLRKNRTRKLRK